MRYQSLILPALAGIAVAQDFPVDELASVPVPTYEVVDGVMTQDIPYATASAVATVTSQVAATPLTVFPAATNVPINSAGEGDDISSLNSTDSVITSGKNKRQARGVARQRHRRAACAPQATIANYYNVDTSSYSAFKADSTIASTANGAATPQGYYQTVKNAPGANSASTCQRS
jgi:hypothetical protein